MGLECCVKEEENSLKQSENSLKVNISRSEEKLIKGVAKFEESQSSELKDSRELQARNEREVKDKWHGQFIRELPEAADKGETW